MRKEKPIAKQDTTLLSERVRHAQRTERAYNLDVGYPPRSHESWEESRPEPSPRFVFVFFVFQEPQELLWCVGA